MLLEGEGFVLVAQEAWTRQRGWKEWEASGGPSPAPAFWGSVEEPFPDHEEQ